MSIGLSRLLRLAGLSSTACDEHLLAGADTGAVEALGASAPVLSIFRQDFATLEPDLVHEAQWAVGRR